jgi:Protein of unknown function (DUF992)
MLDNGKMLLAAAMLCTGLIPATAQQSGTKVGALTCRTSASLGLIVASHQRLSCSFSPNSGPSEHYVGHVNRLGIDLGIRAGGIMTWGVIAPTNGYHRGALTGKYVGASGSASFGVGVGANALIGGWHRSIALQPLSVEGQAGINLALGVAGLRLQAVH